MCAALRHPCQPLRLHLIEHRALLLLSRIVPEQPWLEGGSRAVEAVTVGVVQMGSEGSMACALSKLSRGLSARSVGGEVSAFEGEPYAHAVLASHRSEMEGGALLIRPCIEHGSCFHEHATDLSLPL
jgi:hypothetical protein